MLRLASDPRSSCLGLLSRTAGPTEPGSPVFLHQAVSTGCHSHLDQGRAAGTAGLWGARWNLNEHATKQFVKSWLYYHLSTVSQLCHFGVHSDSPQEAGSVPTHLPTVITNHRVCPGPRGSPRSGSLQPIAWEPGDRACLPEATESPAVAWGGPATLTGAERAVGDPVGGAAGGGAGPAQDWV